jgi:hypothetical protein
MWRKASAHPLGENPTSVFEDLLAGQGVKIPTMELDKAERAISTAGQVLRVSTRECQYVDARVVGREPPLKGVNMTSFQELGNLPGVLKSVRQSHFHSFTPNPLE